MMLLDVMDFYKPSFWYTSVHEALKFITIQRSKVASYLSVYNRHVQTMSCRLHTALDS